MFGRKNRKKQSKNSVKQVQTDTSKLRRKQTHHERLSKKGTLRKISKPDKSYSRASFRLKKRKNSAERSSFRLAKAKSFMSKSVMNLKQLVKFENESESEEEYEIKDSKVRVKRNSIHLSDIEDVPEVKLQNSKKVETKRDSVVFRKAFMTTTNQSFENDKDEMTKFMENSREKLLYNSEDDTITLSSSSAGVEGSPISFLNLRGKQKKVSQETNSDIFLDTSESLLDV